jgi:glycosyltransferase involved in cell wall biosynthesis
MPWNPHLLQNADCGCAGEQPLQLYARALNISIVIPAFNEEKLLPESLRRIGEAAEGFRAEGWGVEVVVCDNNSTDQTAAVARAAGARVVFEPVNQIGRARNTGAAAAQGEWLVFVDADSHPSRALFADVARAIQSGTVLAGGSTLELDEFHLLGTPVTAGWNLISRVLRWAAGSFIFCEAAAFRETGGFNQELYASEEIDLFRRLKRLARQKRRKIVILHQHPVRTSARKVHLYSASEHFRFMVRACLQPRRTLKDRAACPTWYDGRR